jgi:hypothetical protein
MKHNHEFFFFYNNMMMYIKINLFIYIFPLAMANHTIFIVHIKWMVGPLGITHFFFSFFFFDVEISQTMMPLATLLISLESFQWVAVHQVGFIMFQPTMKKLLNIEQFFIKNSLKSWQKIVGEFGHTLGIVGKCSKNRI